MTVKASGQSALILASGLLVCFFAPALAAGLSNAEPNSASESALSPVTPIEAPIQPTMQRAPPLKSLAHAKSGKVAMKSSLSKKAISAANGQDSSAMPPSVANANAELTSRLPVYNATGLAARANQLIPHSAAAPIVSPDQLNDLDRVLQASSPPATTVTMATTDAAAAPAAPIASSDDAASNGDRGSLVGEIFIGIGVLLTLGTVVRMFMA
jgi:hypothetical protein